MTIPYLVLALLVILSIALIARTKGETVTERYHSGLADLSLSLLSRSSTLVRAVLPSSFSPFRDTQTNLNSREARQKKTQEDAGSLTPRKSGLDGQETEDEMSVAGKHTDRDANAELRVDLGSFRLVDDTSLMPAPVIRTIEEAYAIYLTNLDRMLSDFSRARKS